MLSPECLLKSPVETAGPAYRAGLGDLDWYVQGDEYVVTDELGIPT